MYYLKANIERPLSFISAGTFTADAPWIHSSRTIDSYEIMAGIRGKVFIQQDNQKYVLEEGDVLLLLPGHPHKGYALSDKGTSFHWIHFCCRNDAEISDDKVASDEIQLLKNNPYFKGLNSSILIPAFYSPSSLDRVMILAHQLLHVYQARYYSGQAANYLLTSLLIELSEQAVGLDVGPAGREGKLPQILEWIRIHCTGDISLKDVAYEFSYSKEYLARYFRKNMGMSLQEYIHKLKISAAGKLLCESDYSIKEVAGRLGFKDEKYFMRLFKQYEKITPRSFRRAYNMTHLNNK